MIRAYKKCSGRMGKQKFHMFLKWIEIWKTVLKKFLITGGFEAFFLLSVSKI